jgi:hypothetical protein
VYGHVGSMNAEDFEATRAGKLIRAPRGYKALVTTPLPPDVRWSSSLAIAVGAAERALGSLDSFAGMLPSPHLLVRAFVRREAVLSPRSEGTQAPLNDGSGGLSPWKLRLRLLI